MLPISQCYCLWEFLFKRFSPNSGPQLQNSATKQKPKPNPTKPNQAKPPKKKKKKHPIGKLPQKVSWATQTGEVREAGTSVGGSVIFKPQKGPKTDEDGWPGECWIPHDFSTWKKREDSLKFPYFSKGLWAVYRKVIVSWSVEVGWILGWPFWG